MIEILCVLLTVFSASSATLEIVTSDFAPFQIQVGKNVEGIATEIVKEVITLSGETGEIRMYPWPRVYKIAQREANVIIYSINRTPEREKLFKWIGVIAPYDVYFWKMANRPEIVVTSLNDAKKYISGGVFDDVKGAFLLNNGFERGRNIDFVGNDILNIRKIFAGRIDLLISDKLSLTFKVKEAGHDYSELKKLIKVEGISSNLYMAASLQTPDQTVERLHRALEQFKKSKKYRELKRKLK